MSVIGLYGTIEANKKAKLTSLKAGVVYNSFDITGDGKKDKIVASGYKGVNIYVFSYGKKAALVYESVAGTGAYTPVIINYNKGKYNEKSVFWSGWIKDSSKNEFYPA